MKLPIKINEVVVVEGKYDKIKLNSIVDTTIVTTNGFRIFKDKEQMKYLSMLAKKRGLLILTDSDSAGFVIRNHIVSCIDKKYIKNAYIPDIFGKEKRKATKSKEGKLGVEGIDVKTIADCLIRAGVKISDCDTTTTQNNSKKIQKIDFYNDGLTGRDNSTIMRQLFIKELNLPEHITTNALLESANIILNYDEYKKIINKIVKM